MKKHIGYFKNGDEVMEALRTKELYEPYMIYVEDGEGYVEYDGYFYMSSSLNGGQSYENETAIDYQSQGVQFGWNGYQAFWYEIVDISECLTFSGEGGYGTSGYSQSYSDNIYITENEGDTARDAHFTLNLRDEENGSIVYTETYFIHQGYQEPSYEAAYGWDHDGELSTDPEEVAQEGDTKFIRFEYVNEWHVFDSSYIEVASGDTDGSYEVVFEANETFYQNNGYFNVTYSDSDGNSFSGTLAYYQPGLELPTIDADNLAFVEPLGMYISDATYSALTVSFSGLYEGMEWELVDNALGSTVATGNTDGEYSYTIPNPNTGTTLMDYGSLSANIKKYNESTQQWDVVVNRYYNIYLAPNTSGVDRCVFVGYSPTSSSVNIEFNASQMYVVAYTEGGHAVDSWDAMCDNPSFPGDWSFDGQSNYECGSYVLLTPSTNMLDSALTVTVEATFNKGGSASLEIIQDEYQDPKMVPVDNKFSRVVFFDESLNPNEFVMSSGMSSSNVEARNMIPGDVWYASTGGSESSGVFPSVPQLRVSFQANNTGEVVFRGTFSLRVERSGDTIYDDNIECFQAGANPQLCALDYPNAVSDEGHFTVPSNGGTFYIACLCDPYEAFLPNSTGCTVDNSDWTVSYDDDSRAIELVVPANAGGDFGTVSMQFVNTKNPALDTTATLYIEQESSE